MSKCPECLSMVSDWQNAVPLYELTGEREEPKEFCPHCGVSHHPWFNNIFGTVAAKLPPNAKFRVAGKGAFFSETV